MPVKRLFLDLRRRHFIWRVKRRLKIVEAFVSTFMYSRRDPETLKAQQQYLMQEREIILGGIDQYLQVYQPDEVIDLRNDIRKQFKEWLYEINDDIIHQLMYLHDEKAFLAEVEWQRKEGF